MMRRAVVRIRAIVRRSNRVSCKGAERQGREGQREDKEDKEAAEEL